MLNKEKYAKEIAELAVNNEIIALKDNKPISCPEIKCDDCERNSKSGCSRRILTEWANSEYKKPILTEEEKAYLSAVIKPFRDKVQYIAKYSYASEWITIKIIDDSKLTFPSFEKGAMYKGMEEAKEYTLKELGLDND